MSDMPPAYHYTPMLPIHDVESEMVLDLYRTFIDDLALRAIALAESPDDARDEVPSTLHDRQYELDRAFEAFVSIFRLLSIGDRNIPSERLSRVSTAVDDDSPTDGSVAASLTAPEDPVIDPTIDPGLSTLNDVEAPFPDREVDDGADRFLDFMIAMDTLGLEPHQTRSHVYGNIEAPRQISRPT
jgi:hypothetical protein